MTFAPGQTVVLTAYNASALPALVQIAFVDLAGEVLEFRERKLEACRGEAMTLLGGPVHVDAPSSASNGNPAGRRGVVGFLRIRREPSGVGTTPTAVSLSMQIVDLATGRTQGYWGNAARA